MLHRGDEWLRKLAPSILSTGIGAVASSRGNCLRNRLSRVTGAHGILDDRFSGPRGRVNMSTRLLLLAIAATGMAVSGCGDSHVSLERQRIALGKEFAEVITSSDNLNQMLDQTPRIESIAQRLEQLAERRKKLPRPTSAQQAELEKMRDAEAEEMKDKLTAHMQKMTPNLMSGGLPDFSKMQKFQSVAMRLGKANMAFAPERFGGGAGPFMDAPETFAPSASASGPATSGTLPAGELLKVPPGGLAPSGP